MSKGWEAYIRVREHYSGWEDSTNPAQTVGDYLDVDSDGLAKNPEMKERDSKVSGGRFGRPSHMTRESNKPAGNIQIQPRTNDFLQILMSHFQCVHWDEGTITTDNNMGTGTFTFIPLEDTPDWEGSVWGSAAGAGQYVATTGDVYSIEIAKIYGWGLETGAVDNEETFSRGVADVLEFNQSVGEDLQLNPTFKFRSVDLTNAATSEKPPCASGSYSELSRFVDWKGTVTYEYGGEGTAVELQALNFVLNNNTSDRPVIGTRGNARFPFSGRPIYEGNMDMEYTDPGFSNVMLNSGTAYLKSLWYNSAADWFDIQYPNIKFRGFDPPITAGDADVDASIPFRAYPSEDGGTPACVVRVCTTFHVHRNTLWHGEGTQWNSA